MLPWANDKLLSFIIIIRPTFFVAIKRKGKICSVMWWDSNKSLLFKNTPTHIIIVNWDDPHQFLFNSRPFCWVPPFLIPIVILFWSGGAHQTATYHSRHPFCVLKWTRISVITSPRPICSISSGSGTEKSQSVSRIFNLQGVRRQ